MRVPPIKTRQLSALFLGALLLAGCTAVDPEAGNSPPAFISNPVSTVDHNRTYSYTLRIFDADDDSLTLSGQFPGWLSLDADALVLTGLAWWDQLGEHSVVLRLSDGRHETEQAFTITVGVGEIICETDFGDPAASLYILPFPAGKTITLSQSYCPANPAWGHNNWFAYDFDTAIGDTIVAMRGGTVLFTQGQYLDGNRAPGKENFVFIQHSDGTVVHYMHLTQNGPLVSPGQTVTQGQPIALSGDSGGSIGPHVHVTQFRGRTSFNRQYTLPFNFRNAQGILDANRALIGGLSYTALPVTPDDR